MTDTRASLAWAVVALALAMPAAARQAVPAASSSAPAPQALDDARFVRMAGLDGLAEIRMAKLASQRSDSDEVKLAAQKIEQDHENANATLRIVAAGLHIPMPTEPGPKARAQLARLRALDGAAFDTAYVKALIAHHRKAIRLFGMESQQGGHARLRDFAGTTLPILKTHLNMAESLRVGTSAGSLEGLDRYNNSLNHADNTPVSANGRRPTGGG